MNNKETTDMRIELREPTACYRPGQPIIGSLHRQDGNAERESIEIRLIWFTRGKGDRDFEVIDLKTIDHLKDKNPAAFEFNAPRYPCSFSGKLISLIWAIEAISFPDREASIHEIIIALTYGVVLFSLVVQGLTIEPLMRKFRMI